MGIEFFTPDLSTNIDIQYVEGLKAGFPSPADDFAELKIDLNREVVRNQEATFYAKVKGNSMIEAGISDGDVLVIDRSIEPTNNKVAVCYIDGEFTVKRLRVEDDVIWLVPENDEFEPIKVTAENEFMVWGVVTYIIKKL